MLHSFLRRVALRSIATVLTVLPLMQAYVANAQQQRTVATASIPFNFSAGRTQLLAGEYRVVRIGDNMMRLISADAQHVASVMVYPSDKHAGKGSRLQFHGYDGHYFLSSVLLADGRLSVDLVRSRGEKEAMRTALNRATPSADIQVAFVGDAP